MEGDTQELRASFIPAEDIRVLSNSELFSILMSSFHSFFQVGLRVGNLAEFVDLVCRFDYLSFYFWKLPI